MKAPHVVTGIDIGSNIVRVIVAQQDPASDTSKILGVGTAPMRGMQKGVITDVEEGVAALGLALDMAERISGIPVEKAYVSINGSHLTSQNLRGVIAVS